MTTPRKRDLQNRMLSAQGHMRAITKMIGADEPCVDTLCVCQIQAVRGALHAINRELWCGYLLDADCGMRAPNRQKRERTYKQLRQAISGR